MLKFSTIISLIIIIGFLTVSGCTDKNSSTINKDEITSSISFSEFTDIKGNSSASRSLPAGCISPGEIIQIDIAVSEYGFGIVNETLCDGWTFINSSLDPMQVDVFDNEIVFTLLGETSFSYIVEAPLYFNEECTINGYLINQDKRVQLVIGESSLCTS